MNKIKIYDNGELYLTGDIDFELKSIDNVKTWYKDTFLDVLFFGNYSFPRIFYFMKSRIRDFDESSVEAIISQINKRNCRSFNDNVTVVIEYSYMKKEELKEYVETGREIEFVYEGKRYSITYYDDEIVKDYISFREIYKTPVDVSNFEDLCNITYNGVKVIDMWESISEEYVDYDIF